MELSLSFSSLRLPAVIRRSCKASSHENRLIPIISSTTKNNIQLSSNFPSKCSATNKLNLPGIYGESLSSKPLLVGQHKRNSVRVYTFFFFFHCDLRFYGIYSTLSIFSYHFLVVGMIQSYGCWEL